MERQMKRNISLVYILTALNYSWFWIAIWVLYYLKFTNYAGIGILESIMITTAVVGEIPTGALGDLLGKKKTLILAFLIAAVGNLMMGFSSSFDHLAIALLFITLGYTLESGTMQAFVYDSLNQIKQKEKYEKTLGNISTVKMITLAGVSILGGFLYTIFPGLPFIVLGLAQCIAVILGFFLTEPPIDTVKFSLGNYLFQTKQGFAQLFQSSAVLTRNIMIITLSMIIVIHHEVLIDAQLVAQGWSAKELGIIAAVMYLLASGFGQLTPIIAKRFGNWNGFVLTSLLIVITTFLVPIVGVVWGTIIIMSRLGLHEIFGNSASAMINKTTDSKYRATTLSTYQMLSKIPYIFVAYYLGYLMDIWSVNGVVVGTGIVLMCFVLFAQLFYKNPTRLNTAKDTYV